MKNIIEIFLQIDTTGWLVFVIGIILCWHLGTHKNLQKLDVLQKSLNIFLLCGAIFIGTIISNIYLKDVIASRPLCSEGFKNEDLISFYNNMITYLSLAFVIMSLIAYNSIKVLTEEKAETMIDNKLEKKLREKLKNIITEKMEDIIKDVCEEKFSGIQEDIEVLKGNIQQYLNDTENKDLDNEYTNQEIVLPEERTK
jgi:Txe/YoeB family toxin of Txe-Axe toxin-antitoxin module